MRRKRVELEQAVIVAARTFLACAHNFGRDPVAHLTALDQLARAVNALDDHDAAEMTGEGARWVHGSPETSQGAAALASLAQGSARRRIVRAMNRFHNGATDDELERQLSNSHQTVSSARNWLVEAGWLQDSGKRRKTRSGRDAVVWELTPAGQRQIGDL